MRVEYAELQLTRKSELARRDYDTQQALDEAQKDVASARADVEEAEANHEAAKAGPTKEQLAIADAGVEAAAAALAVFERRLDKTTLRAPADGVVRLCPHQWCAAVAREATRNGLAALPARP